MEREKNTSNVLEITAVAYAATSMSIFINLYVWCRQPYILMFNNSNITRLTAICPVLPGWAGSRKVKPIKIYWSKR